MPATTTSDTLRALPFFGGLPDTLLWHLAHAAERRSLATDEALFRQGDVRTLLAIILSGTIVIEQLREGKNVRITSLGAGEVIGEGILLEDSMHVTAGRATQATEVLVFRKDPLMKLLKDQPALYAALLGRAAKIMNDRIRRANALLLSGTGDAAAARAQVGRWLDDIASIAPSIGYDQAVALAREALTAGKTVRELAAERKLAT